MSSIQTDRADAQATMLAGLTLHWHLTLDEIPVDEWDALCAHADGAAPFLQWGFLKALIDSGSATPETGWHPLFLTIRRADQSIVAGCPLFVKTHSYGEYVFDWAWADAHDRALGQAGRHYYPKLLGAVPFSPIPGPRLMVHPTLQPLTQQALQQAMLQAIEQRCLAEEWSSAHLLFVSEADSQIASAQGWLHRTGVQFHWQNTTPNYPDFDAYLHTLQRDKRKKISQERRRVAAAGVRFSVKQGLEITDADWDFFHQCYAHTYLSRGREPYLSRSFWQDPSHGKAIHWLLFTAHVNGEAVACSLIALDPDQKLAFGRYWGAVSHIDCLHFEACYYQPLIWCIAHGYRRFEGGAQGEHKLARGLTPVVTHSIHWIAHPELRNAVARFLERERQGMGCYVHELDARSPFRIHGDESGIQTKNNISKEFDDT